MKRYTKKDLEKLLEDLGVRKCEVCGEYEERSPGVGGAQGSDLGHDPQGRLVHLHCAVK